MHFYFKVFGEMPLTGVDESVKQAILQRNTFENMDVVSSVTTLRSRRGSHVAAMNSGANFFGTISPATAGSGNVLPQANDAGSRRQSRVQFSDLPARDTQTLDLPSTSKAVPGGSSPV